MKIDKIKTNKIKAFLISLILIFIVQFFFCHSVNATPAVGFAWGGTSSTDGAYQGIGWIDMRGGEAQGVDIPTAGDLSGFAWSNNYGWIDFSEVDRVGNFLMGYAYIVAIVDDSNETPPNNGGWTGRIDMSGVDVTKMDGDVTAEGTYAWSGELGWIDFGGVSLSAAPPTYTCLPYCIQSGAGSNCSSALILETCFNDITGFPAIPQTLCNGGAGCSNFISCPCKHPSTGKWEEVAP